MCGVIKNLHCKYYITVPDGYIIQSKRGKRQVELYNYTNGGMTYNIMLITAKFQRFLKILNWHINCFIVLV